MIVNFDEGAFLHNKVTNTLIEVEPQHAIIDLEGNVTYYFKNNGKEFGIAGDDMALYRNRIEYENGEDPICKGAYNIETRLRRDLECCCVFASDDDRCREMVSWMMVDGVPTQVDTPLIGFQAGRFGGCKPLFDSDADLSGLYASKEQALWFNKYKYTDSKGEVVMREGTRAFALLTDEQKKAVAKLKKALDALKDANVNAIYSADYGMWYFLPSDKTTLDWDYCGQTKGLFIPDEVPNDQSFEFGVDYYCCDAPVVNEVKAVEPTKE